MTRLLIIEDDPEIISALTRGLALHGYDASAENRADQGLAQLVSGDFDAAIVDVMLGADSGVDLVRAARNLHPDPATLDTAARTLRRADVETALTEREFDLLTLLIAHFGTPIPRGTIFDALWQADGSSNENVVDVYIGYLRKKLGADDFGIKISTIRNKGFCLEGLRPVQT